MDTTVDLRNKVLNYVSSGDEKLLRMMQVLAERYQSKDVTEDPTVPEWFYKELDDDREKHIKGETDFYSWEEIKDRLRKQYNL
ncbi:MAG: hypothetical protein WCY77_12205 [Weeksellaceae bacterium]